MTSELDDALEMTITVDQAREMGGALDNPVLDELMEKIDQAQGDVHSGKARVSFIIIKIVP